MGGSSYCCPMCARWFFMMGQLRDHVRGAHGLVAVEITGIAGMTRIEGGRPAVTRRPPRSQDALLPDKK